MLVTFGYCAAAYVAGYATATAGSRSPAPARRPIAAYEDDTVQQLMPSSMPPPPPPRPQPRARANWRLPQKVEAAVAFFRSFSEQDSESASKKSRGRQRVELWLIYNWRWLVPLLVSVLAIAYGSIGAVRSEVEAAAEAAQALEQSRAAALEALLSAPAVQLASEAFSSGYLPSGRSMAELERDLREYVAEKDMACATAKHLSAPEHLIVVGKTAMWNSRTVPIADPGEPIKEAESSDFFPDLPAIKVERPSSSYVEYRESGGQQRRIKASGGTLRCIMHCQEVLSGAHMTKFVEAQRAAASKKMRKG